MSSFASDSFTGIQGGVAASEAPKIYYTPMFFCVGLMGFQFYVYNFVYLAVILPAIHKAEFVPVFAALFNLVWFLTFWTYVTVHCSDPGTITEKWRAFVRDSPGLDVVVSRQEWQPGKVTTNKKSNELRPERAHFCSMTRQDVLRMDHYCPWTGNVIGCGNHKHFLLLGFYGGLAGAVAFLTALPDLIGCTTGYSNNAFIWMQVPVFYRFIFIAFGFFAVVVMLLLFGLFTSHFPLACQNMTTIEELYINMPNPYDQQNWFRNLEQLFGVFGWDWFFPVKPRHLKSDGFSYRRNGEVLPEGLVEIYGEDVRLQHGDDFEKLVLHKLPEDIWHFRYTGQRRGADSKEKDSTNTSWFAWLAGG